MTRAALPVPRWCLPSVGGAIACASHARPATHLEVVSGSHLVCLSHGPASGQHHDLPKPSPRPVTPAAGLHVLLCHPSRLPRAASCTDRQREVLASCPGRRSPLHTLNLHINFRISLLNSTYTHIKSVGTMNVLTRQANLRWGQRTPLQYLLQTYVRLFLTIIVKVIVFCSHQNKITPVWG